MRQQAAQYRAQLKLPENYFSASNRFIEKKNLGRLLLAYANYVGVQGAQAWHLVLLGDGPLRRQLENLAKRLGLTGLVHFEGFKQYGELPAYYALAKVFMHASTSEQCGLVVNEAMACGLQVLVSQRCGCVLDLVLDAWNGYTFDPYDLELLELVLLC